MIFALDNYKESIEAKKWDGWNFHNFVRLQWNAHHTEILDSQLSQVITKDYSNAPRVPMGTWGSVCDPKTQS